MPLQELDEAAAVGPEEAAVGAPQAVPEMAVELALEHRAQLAEVGEPLVEQLDLDPARRLVAVVLLDVPHREGREHAGVEDVLPAADRPRVARTERGGPDELRPFDGHGEGGRPPVRPPLPDEPDLRGCDEGELQLVEVPELDLRLAV